MNLVLTIQFWKHETPPKGASVAQLFWLPRSFNRFLRSTKIERFAGVLGDLDDVLKTQYDRRIPKRDFGDFGPTAGSQSDRQGMAKSANTMHTCNVL